MLGEYAQLSVLAMRTKNKSSPYLIFLIFYRISIPPCFFLIAASGGSCYPPLLIGHFLGFRQSSYEIFSENRLFKQYEGDEFVKNAEKYFLSPNRLTILMFFVL